VIGPRPGEKCHEELVDLNEIPEPTGRAGIVAATPPAPDPAALRRRLRAMEALAKEGRHAELAEQLRGSVSEDVPALAGVEEAS